MLLASSRVTLAWHKAKRGTPFGVTKRLIPVSRKKNEGQGVNWNENDWNVRACICFAISNRLLQRLLLAIARTQSPLPEILLWTTPSEPPRALQASECSELLDPTRASCLILAQRQPGKFINAGRASRLHLSIGERALLARELTTGRKPNQKLQENHQDSLDGSRSSFQLANSTPPQGVIDCAIAPSARIL